MLRIVTAPYLAKYFFSELVWSINNHEKRLYLTFDDGPTPAVTDAILDLLNSYDAKATFFCLGKKVCSVICS